jgi:hypothetical protein
VLEALHKAMFVSVSAELWVLCGEGIKLAHVDEAIIW